MNQFNIELDWKFTRSLTTSLACSKRPKPYRGQVSDKADLFSRTFIGLKLDAHTFFHLRVVLRYMHSYLTLLMANIKNLKKLQLIQTI